MSFTAALKAPEGSSLMRIVMRAGLLAGFVAVATACTPVASMLAPPVARQSGVAPVSASAPPNASPYECWTDNGYGRYSPCSAVE